MQMAESNLNAHSSLQTMYSDGVIRMDFLVELTKHYNFTQLLMLIECTNQDH